MPRVESKVRRVYRVQLVPVWALDFGPESNSRACPVPWFARWLMFAPVPDSTYKFQVHFNAMPTSLVTNTSGTYISRNFGNGLLYACLVEAYGFLKGPMDMLTMYEQKYNNVVQKFAAEQIGRRRRDDYTDGTIRIPIESPNP